MILEIHRGLATHRKRTVTEPGFLLGMNPECDLVLDHPLFAPIHFYLPRRGGRTSMRTVRNTPDVTINGEPKRVSPVADGDRIRTGPYEFVLKAG